ncbi:cyclopentanol dehydrogenase-like isoform X2 [Lineus longissimus]|uniref:cyclopentanol dehydrogenase-like isoform X2 n=1 Tax=Lineus longissimus TaxID=88925 RepID=UPI00315D93C4
MAKQLVLDSAATKTRFVCRVFIVTGGASGVGLATAERLLNDGASVAIFDINNQAGEEAEQRLKSSGYAVRFYSVDVSQQDICAEAVGRVVSELGTGSIHGLVNSAVYFGSQGLQATNADWEKTMSVNVLGVSNMVQACVPYMKKEDPAIVNLTSISGLRAQPNRWTYATSKGGIISLTKCMALDLSERGIRVNSCSPSWVWTPEVLKAAKNDRATHEPKWGAYHMLRRIAEPCEVAASIVFLLSKDASFITGANLDVDGGYTAMSAEGYGDPNNFAGTTYEAEKKKSDTN